MRFSGLFFVVYALMAGGCGFGDDDGPTTVCNPVPVSEEEDIINQYIDQNGLTMQTTSSGLRYSIDTPGTGDNIMYGDEVEVEYRGSLLTGSVFDQGTLPLFTLTEDSFIPGFEEALLLFNEGAEGMIIIPSSLAYGCFPPTGSIIGDNEVLVFEINILSVNP